MNEALPCGWIPLLVEMFGAVCDFLRGRGKLSREGVGMNPKGQETLAFDAGAEEVAIQFCQHRIARPVRILSEERGEIRLRPDLGEPEFTLIIDPVDGSENFKRGIELTCFSVAVLPVDAPRAPAAVVAGLIGNVISGTYQTAVRGQGAHAVDGKLLQASRVGELREALVEMEPDFGNPGFRHRVEGLLQRAKEVRVLGSAVASQMGVASGGIEAYIDVRGGLTPENFMAGALIIEEAGGVVTDVWGRPLPPFEKMTDGFLYLASANRSLHRQILDVLQMEV
jgi:myo-inositol-1(or 4)-monophosphatase